MLLTVDEIGEALRSKLSGPTLRQMRLEGPGVSEGIVNETSDLIGMTLPASLKNYLKLFDFSRLRMHGLIFHYGDRLQKFVAINLGQPYPWWRGDKPAHSIWTCHTDGHMLIMDENVGTVRAFDKGTAADRGVVSLDFELLILGAGTLAARQTRTNRTELAKEIAHDVGAASDEFWRQLATGTA
jgi:hypothetical protein